MVEVSLTVGKLDASLALLLTKDHHLIEFPTILLPNGVKAGSIVKIKCEQDFETEEKELNQFRSIQDEILNTFGKNLPKDPQLKIKNVTQTSCVLEWDELDLGTSNLKNLFLFKDGKKLGSIPQPLTNRTTKLSGLPIDETFEFQLKLDTTAGIYESDILKVTTHKMTDLSGINVCLGDISPNEQFTVDDIDETLKAIGAHHPHQSKVSVDTTHFICTRENKSNPEYLKAFDMNIPIIRPEWLKACERDRRIVGVREYYIKDCVLPDIFAKNFWNKSSSTPIANPVNDNDKPVPELPIGESMSTMPIPEIKEPESEEEAPEKSEVNGSNEKKETVTPADSVEIKQEIHEINLDESTEKHDPIAESTIPEVVVEEKANEVNTPTESEIKTDFAEQEKTADVVPEPSPEPVVEPVVEPVAEPVVEPELEEINLEEPSTEIGNDAKEEIPIDVEVEDAEDAEDDDEPEKEDEGKEEGDKIDKPASKKNKKNKKKKKKN
ncbi:chitin biosynthesis protein Chs5p [[Candida] jaroonii]|uniref:Chitin biosynthesis protein Chs5p n=1 Tax=[Candida] jaroonii TaxID=467808 RepID=A0ACA9YER2_9ASCO|nr:chitin biosynthesis protein Chs5p [[Candida] jaroonii]